MRPQVALALWAAINRYAVACGGDPPNRDRRGSPRQRAVAEVDGVVNAALAVESARIAYWRTKYEASAARHDVVDAEREGTSEAHDAAIAEAEEADRAHEEAAAALKKLGGKP